MPIARLPLTALLLLAACPAPEPRTDARIVRMLGCIECMDGEQAAVVTMGDSAVPALRAVVLGVAPHSELARDRASLALGLIGGDRARRVLCERRALAPGTGALRFIDSALVLLGGRCP